MLMLLTFALMLPVRYQSPPGPLLWPFLRGGPVVEGVIQDVETPTPPTGKGIIVLSVTRTLRGAVTPLQLQITFVPSHGNPKRPPIRWARVTPAKGKHVLVILNPAGRQALAVLDLDAGEAAWVPILERMVELQKDANLGNTEALFASLSDATPIIRALSIRLLAGGGHLSRAENRTRVFGVLATQAHDKSNPLGERLDAIATMGTQDYKGASPNDPVNLRILSFLFTLLQDPETAVRGQAVQVLFSVLLGAGAKRPDLENVSIPDVAEIREQLQKDVRDRLYYASEAQALLRAISQK